MIYLIIWSLILATACNAELYHGYSALPPIKNEGRITNGNMAGVGQFPYQVGLSLQISSTLSSWCGGSLIGKRWILTAAHCTDGVQSVTVYVGATKRTSAEAFYTVTKNEIIIHSNWNSKILRNDISLIRIPTVSFTSRVQPIKLPPLASSYSTYEGDYVIASGWGRIYDNVNSVTNDLQWARLQVITNSVCSLTYGTNVLFPTNICVSTMGGVSTCQGDSGGPLVLESSCIQIGLVSFGAGDGCALGYPVAFTRLTKYLDWIKVNTGISY